GMTAELTRLESLTFPALPGGLDTPRVVVDLARVAANIERLQVEMDRRGIALRPHAKTHKSVAVARMQLGAGAGGITVGTLGEATAGLRADGFAIDTISAGSTPTMLSAATGDVNEMRAGTYVYGDRQQWTLGAIPADGCAVAVAATVVSVHADRIVLD